MSNDTVDNTTIVPRTRTRRLNLMALIFVALGVWLIHTCSEVWYKFYLPASTTIPSFGIKVSQVTAAKDLSGSWLAKNTGVASTLGVPTTVFFALMVVLFGILMVFIKNTFVGIVGLICGFLSWKQIGVLRGELENPATGGALNHPAIGLKHFQTALVLALAMLILTTLQVAIVNHKQREAEKQKLGDEGKAKPGLPSIFDVIAAMQAFQTSRFTRSVPVDPAEKPKEIKK